MKATSLKSAIIKLGGTAEITSSTQRNSYGIRERFELKGELNGYDVEMVGDESNFFTVRSIAKRGFYDPGSDYNSGGYTFCNRIKDLEIYCRAKVMA